jgi:hypothetical protein
LIDARHKINIMDVRIYRVTNADSEHYPVITRIRARIFMLNMFRIKRKQQDTI